MQDTVTNKYFIIYQKNDKDENSLSLFSSFRLKDQIIVSAKEKDKIEPSLIM